jgi:hypothetical protein
MSPKLPELKEDIQYIPYTYQAGKIGHIDKNKYCLSH